VKSFASIVRPMTAPTRHITLVTAIAMTRMVSLLVQPQVSPPMLRSPYKILGVKKSMAFMQTMFKAYAKAKTKKASKTKKGKKHEYNSSSGSNSE
jgi:hypothetical protein